MRERNYPIEKTCYKCSETKSIAAFVRRSGPKSMYRNICKACEVIRTRPERTSPRGRQRSAAYWKKWLSNPDNKARAKQQREARNKLSPKVAFRLMIFNARKRAEIFLTIDDLTGLWENQNRRCAITNIAMTWGQGRITPTSMSLDRIDPDAPYTVNNVRLVCHAINAFRGRMTDAEMLTMARAIVDNMSKSSREPSWQPHIVSSEAA